jgi:nucleotide-binding universal stress UspA family protein
MDKTPSLQGFTFKRILVCVADDGLSDDAVRAAAELAGQLDSELELLHVQREPFLVSPRFPLAHLESWRSVRVATTRERLREHLSTALAGVIVRNTPMAERLRVLSGSPARVVLDQVVRTGADLIVIGDSGKRTQLDFGGTARAVLSHATVPVWVQVQRPRPIRRILAPIDLSPSSFELLRHAAELARLLSAKVTALHCFSATEFLLYGALDVPMQPPGFSLEQLRNDAIAHFDREIQRTEWGGVEHDRRFIDDDPVRAILAMQNEFDLIVLGTDGHAGLTAALLGGVAYGVLREARTPVLAMRLKPENRVG